MNSKRIVFAGTPEFAAIHLKALLNSGVKPVAVYTQPDRPAGRGRKLTQSPVKELAESANLAVYQPVSLKNPEDQAVLASLEADLMIVVAYGLILPQAVLDLPRMGCVNVHASMLPRWRGAAPIHRALLAGDQETGVTLMQMEAGLDTGPMLAWTTTQIKSDETSGALHDRLANLGAELLTSHLESLLDGSLSPVEQDDTQATYATKLEKAEGSINWSQSAQAIDRQVRGLNPWPVAQTQLNGQALRIWGAGWEASDRGAAPGVVCEVGKSAISVSTGSGTLNLTQIQLPGKRAMKVSEILNSSSHPFQLGIQLG